MQGYELDPAATLPRVMARNAAEHPDRVFLRQVGRPDMTFEEVHQTGQRWSRVLSDLGVRAGDRVATMLHPGADSLCAWLGIGAIGAIDAGINVDFRGRMLRYVIDLAQAEVVIVDAMLLPRLLEIRGDLQLRALLVVGGVPAGAPSLALDGTELVASAVPLETEGPEHWDTACLTYTSGTTGPSKAVIVPWGQLYTFARLLFSIEDLDDRDVFYSPWPVYHTNGRFGAYAMALVGGTIVFNHRFHLSTWMAEVEHYRVTTMVLFAMLVESLRNATDEQAAQVATLRNVVGAWGPDHAELAERFGLRTRSCFAMTECPPVLLSPGWKVENWRAAGKLHQGFPGFEIRLVDEHDQEVPQGHPGELVVRSATPWTMNAGYFANPDATAKAWRNGWFHTGDSLRADADGHLYFIDRTSDSIRRRGENISSFEVEAYVKEHPDVRECAAVAASMPDERDEEVKIVVMLADGSPLTHEALIEFLHDRMPSFMVPRFVEFVTDFPRTAATMKIRKVELRADALNDDTWDRESSALARGRS